MNAVALVTAVGGDSSIFGQRRIFNTILLLLLFHVSVTFSPFPPPHSSSSHKIMTIILHFTQLTLSEIFSLREKQFFLSRDMNVRVCCVWCAVCACATHTVFSMFRNIIVLKKNVRRNGGKKRTSVEQKRSRSIIM